MIFASLLPRIKYQTHDLISPWWVGTRNRSGCGLIWCVSFCSKWGGRGVAGGPGGGSLPSRRRKRSGSAATLLLPPFWPRLGNFVHVTSLRNTSSSNREAPLLGEGVSAILVLICTSRTPRRPT
eukprot:15444888-Alexandrium_andersonii.AAC.2